MMTIHKIKYIVAIILVLTATSCKKFLDVKPQEQVDDDVTITDKLTAETALQGVYNGLTQDGYYGISFQSIGYFGGDNVQWTGSQSIVLQFINNDVRADNATVGTIWGAIYSTINRANHVLAKVPAVTDLTQLQRNQILGEAYFVRALAYFDLARTYGGVPIITKPTIQPSDNSRIPRSSQAETYAQVLSDLNSAETLLPNTLNRFRATKKTVLALKARYFLYQSDWSQAEQYATSVINDASYTLIKPYSAFFLNNAIGTNESVFELFYSSNRVNTHRASWQPPVNGGTRQWAPSAAVITLLNDSTVGGNRKALLARTAAPANLWYGTLYYRNPATDPAYVIRIAELYLSRAEARAQQDNLPGALVDLNAIRTRAGLLELPIDSIPNKENLLLRIENERRVEFALEPHRFFDLTRTDRLATLKGLPNRNRYVLPIPALQISTDPALQQNPGY